MAPNVWEAVFRKIKNVRPWRRARLTLNLLNTSKYVFIAILTKEAIDKNWQIEWTLVVAIVFTNIVFTWLNDFPEWDIEVAKKKEVEDQLKKEKESEVQNV